MNNKIIIFAILFLCVMRRAEADYAYVDFFPDKEMILGTGDKIYPIDHQKIRLFKVGEFTYPISKTVIISDKDLHVLVGIISKPSKPMSLKESRDRLNEAIGGGALHTTDGHVSYFLLNNFEIITISIHTTRGKFH